MTLGDEVAYIVTPFKYRITYDNLADWDTAVVAIALKFSFIVNGTVVVRDKEVRVCYWDYDSQTGWVWNGVNFI